MAWKPISPESVDQFTKCIAATHDGHTLSANDQKIVTDCFEGAFSEGDNGGTPEPPPVPSTCQNGYRGGVEWWQHYCLDEPPKFKTAAGGVGIMGTNADGVRAFPDGQRKKDGKVAFEVFFATAKVPQGTGGLHLGCLTSAHKAWNSPVGSPQYKGWLRQDWQFYNGDGTNCELRIGMYIADENGSNFVVRTWNTGIILRPQRWIPLSFSWDRISSTEFKQVVSSESRRAEHTTQIYAGSQNIQGWKFGNMDNLSDFGGKPEVHFRNVVASETP
jgi:hypothetical protein